MKKTLMTGVILLSFLSPLSAQINSSKNLEDIARINVGLHGLDVSYELALSNKFIWENSIGFGMGSNVFGTSVEYNFYLNQPVPYLKSELKYLYNIRKRIRKGKNTSDNSGNYIGLQTKYSSGNRTNYELDKTLLTEVHWGLQRNIGKKFLFNFHVGFGHINDFDTGDGSLSPAFGARFGYRIF